MMNLIKKRVLIFKVCCVLFHGYPTSKCLSLYLFTCGVFHGR